MRQTKERERAEENEIMAVKTGCTREACPVAAYLETMICKGVSN
jgi:hypothetical protein